MLLRSVALVVSLVLASAGTAGAAIITTYTDRALFVAAQMPTSGNTITIGSPGGGPDISLIGAQPTISPSPASDNNLTVLADTGNLFGIGSALSTETERVTLVLSFAQPILAIGLYPYITDDAFVAGNGTLLLTLVGSGADTVVTSASGPAFIGYQSDVGFTSLTIALDTFDQNLIAAPYVTLADTIFLGASPVSVPAPGPIALLLPSLALLCLRTRRRPSR